MFAPQFRHGRPDAVALALVLTAPLAHAAVYTVGNDNSCHHPDLQAAIDALPTGGSHELRLKSGTYLQQAVKIESRTLVIEGGYTTCDAATPAGTSTLDGAGGTSDSVITISGSNNNITLRRLSVRNGDETPGSHGGGIDFNGTGTLTLEDTLVTGNYAGYGGGISFEAPAGSTLVIGDNTMVMGNTAQYSGGGIRVAGGARLDMRGTNVAVSDNEALGLNPATNVETGGYGGGIQVINGSSADISATPLPSGLLIAGNRAVHGGGIAVRSESGGASRLTVFSRNGSVPARLDGNVASRTGGGIYLAGTSGSNSVTACLWDVALTENTAQNGAAIYTDSPGGSVPKVMVNSSSLACGVRPAESQPCRNGAYCGLVAGNRAETVDGDPTDGAIVLMQNRSEVVLNALRFVENEARNIYRGFNDGAERHVLHSFLMADNIVTGPLLRFEGGSVPGFDIQGCTIAGNAIAGSQVISHVDGGSIRNCIIWQPGRAVVNTTSATVSGSNLIVHATGPLSGPSLLVADPRFADPDAGDYRPHPSSPAVDAIAVPSPNTDVEGTVRDIDIHYVYNGSGPADIGAYELAADRPLVRNGTMDGNVRHWSGGAALSWVDGTDIVGGQGSGVLRLSGAVAQGGRLVASQCVPLPGPGNYELTAWGRSTGTVIAGADSARIAWTLYGYDPDLDCSGDVAASDDVLVGVGGNWRELSPQPIQFISRAWSGKASLRIDLIAQDGGLPNANPSVTAEFDGVQLRYVAHMDDFIFQDGFDRN